MREDSATFVPRHNGIGRWRGLLTFLLFAELGAVASAQPQAAISGPTRVNDRSPIEFSVTVKDYPARGVLRLKWRSEPRGLQFRPANQGDPDKQWLIAHAWGPVGTYIVISEGFVIDWDAESLTPLDFETRLVVGVGVPDPDPPTPPDPDVPDPDVPDDPTFPNQKLGFSTLAYDHAKRLTDQARFADLARNFRSVAAGVATGTWKTSASANGELQRLNRLTLKHGTPQSEVEKYLPWFTAWKNYADIQSGTGVLKETAESYAVAYTETAIGLEKLVASAKNSLLMLTPRGQEFYPVLWTGRASWTRSIWNANQQTKWIVGRIYRGQQYSIYGYYGTSQLCKIAGQPAGWAWINQR